MGEAYGSLVGKAHLHIYIVCLLCAFNALLKIAAFLVNFRGHSQPDCQFERILILPADAYGLHNIFFPLLCASRCKRDPCKSVERVGHPLPILHLPGNLKGPLCIFESLRVVGFAEMENGDDTADIGLYLRCARCFAQFKRLLGVLERVGIVLKIEIPLARPIPGEESYTLCAAIRLKFNLAVREPLPLYKGEEALCSGACLRAALLLEACQQRVCVLGECFCGNNKGYCKQDCAQRDSHKWRKIAISAPLP